MTNVADPSPTLPPVGLVLSLPASAAAGAALAAELGCPAATIDCHRFPDGESRIVLPSSPPAHVAFSASLDDPDAKLVALMLAARTARELGASVLTLVAPYLCYMRQDQAFRPGEAVSQRIGCSRGTACGPCSSGPTRSPRSGSRRSPPRRAWSTPCAPSSVPVTGWSRSGCPTSTCGAAR